MRKDVLAEIRDLQLKGSRTSRTFFNSGGSQSSIEHDLQESDRIVREATERVVNETKLLSTLYRIDSALLQGKFNKSEVIYTPEKGKVLLAWGSDFSSDVNGNITSGNCSFILIRVNPSDDSIRVWGEDDRPNVVTKKDRRDENALTKAIAKAFTKPAAVSSTFDLPNEPDPHGHIT